MQERVHERCAVLAREEKRRELRALRTARVLEKAGGDRGADREVVGLEQALRRGRGAWLTGREENLTIETKLTNLFSCSF